MRNWIAGIALVFLAAPLAAQDVAECGAGFREFDFWVGQWTVTDQAGSATFGSNSITLVVETCTVREEWTSGSSNKGWSLNMYDAVRGDWTQIWMDDQGLELHMTGGLVDGAMVLEGLSNGVLNRVTWTPLEDGRVRQFWQSSANGGTTWAVQFDGYYSRIQGSLVF